MNYTHPKAVYMSFPTITWPAIPARLRQHLLSELRLTIYPAAILAVAWVIDLTTLCH